VDVIVTSATPTSLAVRQATSTIPIVFAAVGDPIGAGLVASLARPGGNVTGLSLQQPDTASKRLELLRDVVPGLRQVAIMTNVDNASAMIDMRETLTAARTFGLDTVKSEIRRPEDIAQQLMDLRVVQTPFTSATIHWLLPIGFASAHWRWARGCRRCSMPRNTSRWAV
jgi:putative ABC transport system substrate-binding protein